jgi:cell division protein FtsW
MLAKLINWERIKPKGDPFMWAIIALLSLWGSLAVYSSTSALAYVKHGASAEMFLFQQLAYLFIGAYVMLYVHSIHYKKFMKIAKLGLYFSYGLLLLTLFVGSEINDAQRWLTIPIIGVTFQTSEVAKVALILFIASELAKRQEDIKDFKKGFLPILTHVVLISLLIAPNNLSTALVLATTCFVIMFIGRVSIKHISYIIIPTLLAMLLMGFIVFKTPDKYLKPFGRLLTWKHRIENFINPVDNPDVTYQNDHANIAIATGGFWGKGPGQSTERNFLPEAYSDFIYAIIVEEYGIFVGGIGLLFLYLFFMYRAFRIIVKSPRAFGALVAIGLSFALVMQALINMAVAVGLFPVTGLTLPLVSKGGTSIIITSFAFGMIMSVSRFVEEEQVVSEKNNQ